MRCLHVPMLLPSLGLMDTTARKTAFSDLFGATFHTFKSNYALCLGLSFVLLVITFVTLAVVFAVGITFSSRDSLYSGAIAAIIAQFTLFTLVVTPVTIVLIFAVIARIRDESGKRPGWFVRVLLISFIAHLLLLPALICSQIGDPGSFEVLKLIPEKVSLGNQMSTFRVSGTPVPPDVQQASDQLNAENDAIRANQNDLLRTLGVLFYVAALFVIVVWLPWASLAACDLREQCQTLSETLARGSSLASGAAIGLIASYVVVIVIMMITFAACGLPGIFFGFPLAFAWIPGSYLLLRDRAVDQPDPEPA